MRILEAKLDWVNIILDGTYGIFYSKTNWRRLDTDSDSEWYQWNHWRHTSPLYARTRKISLEWYVDNLWNAKELEAVEHLENLFALQGNPGSVVPRLLYIKDIHWKEWIMNVKIAEPLDIEETDDDMRDYAWEWRVELESIEDPRYYSAEEVSQNILELDYGWFTMDFSLWFTMDEYTNVMTLSVDWNAEAPMRWEIDVISDFTWPLTIRNLDTGDQMVFDIDWVIGDSIIIDTRYYTATKNGDDITWYRVPGSKWLKINWTQNFAIFSIDGWLDHSDFDVNVFFRNVLL